MAKAKKRKSTKSSSKKSCTGLKANGRLKKGYKWKKGSSCPVKATKKARKRRSKK